MLPLAPRILAETGLTLTLRDVFPVSPGHTLVITKRHVESFFDASAEEHTEILVAVR